MNMQSGDEPAHLSGWVYEILLDMIFRGELRPGQAVRERQLAAYLGVSRTPLREALNRLTGERWLRRSPEGELTVAAMGVEEFVEVLHVRGLLEREAAALAAGRIPQDHIDALIHRVERVLAAAGSGRLADESLDDEIHDTVARATGNHTLAELIADVRRRTRIFSLKRMPGRVERVSREHLALLRALREGDPARAAQAMDEHIASIREHVADSLKSIAPLSPRGAGRL